MNKFFTAIAILISTLAIAQTGTIEGSLIDKDQNNEPLPFANVIIKGTNQGTTTDFDGNYIIENVPVGTYTVEFSFVGYETLEIPNVIVEAEKYTRIDTGLGASAATLDEVIIKVQTSRERETALLLEQKNAIEVRESIGAEQLRKLGVTDASDATTKISGVNKTEGSGDVFVRGLGDRYLYTTMNGLPIPSDNVDRKNIDLELFSTRLIKNVSISKTVNPAFSADQASGNIDIASKELSGSELLQVRMRAGVNTNVMSNGVYDNFKASVNQNDVTLGFYQRDLNTFDAITQQGWDPIQQSTPINSSISLSAGKKFGEKLKVLLTAGQSSNYEYNEGEFKQFRSNFIDDTIPDAITWKKTVASSALLNTSYKIDDNNDIAFNTLFVNTLKETVFEGGRSGGAGIFEETDPEEGLSQFIRDQNLKKTLLSVTQLLGTHDISENNTLDWGLAYNYLSADEPNRIRNELNIDPDSDFVQLGRTGGFQQRKSIQLIEDVEYAGRINDEIKIVDDEERFLKLDIGANYRYKTRDFGSQFVGVEEAFTNAINPTSIDDMDSVFTQTNFDNNILDYNILTPDVYEGKLQSLAGYFDLTGSIGKLSVQTGLRFQKDDIDVDFAVNNFPGREGSSNKDYRRLYPSVTFKYDINEKHSLRFANSNTQTLPEFKEIAPFEYVSPQGQVTRGNPNIDASTNYNFDLKWEFFPTSDQLFSLTGFYKRIEDPINRVQDRGSAGVFSYFNSGDKAQVLGIEFEGRINLLSGEEEGDPKLRLNLNASYMWHEQDLKEIFDEDGNFVRTFRYKGLTKTGLQGASDFITNASLNFNTNDENPFDANVVVNYASDRIFALGAPEIQTSSDINYNDAIVEKGFVTLDVILNKAIGEHWSVGLRARNILNPTIKRTQLVKPSTTGIETEETVLSYSKGAQYGLNLRYSF